MAIRGRALLVVVFASVALAGATAAAGSKKKLSQKPATKRIVVDLQGQPECEEGVHLSADEADYRAAQSRLESRVLASVQQPIEE